MTYSINLKYKGGSNINSVERSRSAAVTEVKKALLPKEYCSVLPLMVFKSPSSKNLGEFKTEFVLKLSIIAAQSS